jgi:hypothetical protein
MMDILIWTVIIQIRDKHNNIIAKLRTAGMNTCPINGTPGGGQLENQLH